MGGHHTAPLGPRTPGASQVVSVRRAVQVRHICHRAATTVPPLCTPCDTRLLGRGSGCQKGRGSGSGQRRGNGYQQPFHQRAAPSRTIRLQNQAANPRREAPARRASLRAGITNRTTASATSSPQNRRGIAGAPRYRRRRGLHQTGPPPNGAFGSEPWRHTLGSSCSLELVVR